VPPQPNCPPAGVLFRVSSSVLKEWCYIDAFPSSENNGATLPLTLCSQNRSAATSYSKVPQGLCFPLGVPGLCTRQNVRKLLGRDSRHLVKPFMQVTIQMTRHFAHICYFPFPFEKVLTIFMACCNFLQHPFIAERVGLYLNF